MGPRQSRFHARLSAVFFGSAMLVFGVDGLEQTWFQARYAVEHAKQGGYTAENAAQRLEISFAPSETRLMHADSTVALRLGGYGRGDKLHHPGLARMAGVGNRVEYQWGGL